MYIYIYNSILLHNGMASIKSMNQLRVRALFLLCALSMGYCSI